MDSSTTTEDMESTSTTMYTTSEIVYETIPYNPADDPTNDLTECVYSAMASFDTLEQITISICGYVDDDDMSYTDIKLDLPSNLWVIIGMKADGEVTDTDTFANYDGYNIEISLENSIEEAYYMSDGDEIELPSFIEVLGDTISEGRRILRLMRLEAIVAADINDTAIADGRNASEIVDYYFDFGDLSTCNDMARISATFGPNEGARLSATKDKFTRETYSNRKAIQVTYDEDCDVEIDDAPQQFINIFVALFIGFIAMLV